VVARGTALDRRRHQLRVAPHGTQRPGKWFARIAFRRYHSAKFIERLIGLIADLKAFFLVMVEVMIEKPVVALRGSSMLRRMSVAAAIATQVVIGAPASANDDPDCHHGGNIDCGQHNMMLIGRDAPFISHLPMFGNEHRFQVIARTHFTGGGEDLDPLYAVDREENLEVRMYTVRPDEQFVLSSLFSPVTEPARNSFDGTVFRGHLERGGREIDGLRTISVEIEEVVYARELQEVRPQSNLQYVLFGSQGDLYVAHLISGTPDFDQVIPIAIDEDNITLHALPNGSIVTIPERDNTAATRLREGETVLGEVLASGSDEVMPLRISVGPEYYFEEGELLVPPMFDPTELEQNAGF
jgi:hypothetical protein